MNKGCWTTMALACLMATAAPAQAANPTPGAAEPAVQWEHFLSTADLQVIKSAYEVVGAVGYDGYTVDADRCRQQGPTLEKTLAAIPVSMVLRRIAYLCAQTTGDVQAADRAMDDLLALAKHAYQEAGEDGTSRPIRVLLPADAVALVLTSGLESAYAYYPKSVPQRYFPLVIAARDPETGIERHLTFDYIDSLFRIDHEAPFTGLPARRNVLAKAFIDELAKEEIPFAADRKAANEAQGDTAHRIATLRPAAEHGGIEASKAWLLLCKQARDSDCASGLVDALLPQAEKQNAYPMVLLSLAYLDGIGIPRDPEAAWALLDGANRHWKADGAYVEFTRIWLQAHGAASVLPPELQSRLAQAEQRGNRFPRRMRIGLKVQNGDTLSDADVAFLADADENVDGAGYEMLSEAAQAAGQQAEMVRWMLKAADAGDADAQARYGIALDRGDDGLGVDRAKGRQWLERGAHGGSSSAAGYRAYLAERDGRWSEAEGWLLPAIMAGSQEAALELANLYAQEFPGLSGKLDRAVVLYRALDQDGSAAARRHLADFAANGRGMPKNPEQARKWLLQDAEKNDPESMAQLAALYATGELGKPDMTEAVRWVDRALSTGNANARDQSASVLYHFVATPDARARALALWQQGADQNDDEARNNLAWALCTSAYTAELDEKRGLLLAKAMNTSDPLHVAYLDTLASCHAAVGEYDRGAELQQQVIAQVEHLYAADSAAERARRLQDFRDRLDLYRAHKPYRVPLPTQSDASKPNSSVSLTSSPTK